MLNEIKAEGKVLFREEKDSGALKLCVAVPHQHNYGGHIADVESKIDFYISDPKVHDETDADVGDWVSVTGHLLMYLKVSKRGVEHRYLTAYADKVDVLRRRIVDKTKERLGM